MKREVKKKTNIFWKFSRQQQIRNYKFCIYFLNQSTGTYI